MAAKFRAPEFPDELNVPIAFDQSMIVALLELGKEADPTRVTQIVVNYCRKELERRLLKLLKHYGIEKSHPDAGWILASRLALDCVRGMQIVENAPRRRGRPPLWKTDKGRALLADVGKIRTERGVGVADAIRFLVKRHPERWGKYKFGTLETRYHEALSVGFREVRR